MRPSFRPGFGGQLRGFKANGCIDAKNDSNDCLRYCIVAGKKALEDAYLAADTRYAARGGPLNHDIVKCRKNY
ncbi:putative beta-ketoacyl-[acyl-carrier-protein] synthase I [Helianthus anomalus]